MRNYIIGTSGHIDHGKTSIVKALTGIDTDRLKEEKEKGISIDIGFSFLEIDDNRVGIIDIPGHEKFIKNMLAGASGVDICLFIVAADDGIMPQTQEHFDILNLLNIEHGVIVLNKCDKVEHEMIEKRKAELKKFCENSFLENSPIVETSILRPDTIENLKTEIKQLILKINETKNSANIFRMPIDRSFSLKGIGNVITGTTIGKNVNVGDKLEILPQQKLVTVRNIQSHNVDKMTLESNNRCALNITFNEKLDIVRGNVIATPSKLHTTKIIDVELSALKNSKVKNGQRVRVYHLANEVMARVKLLTTNELEKGESGFAQLLLENSIIALEGDIVILRNYSPLVTIGGGEIKNVRAKSVKRFDEEYVNKLSVLSESDDVAKVEKIILDMSFEFLTLEEITQQLISVENYKSIIDNDLSDKVTNVNGVLLHLDYVNDLELQIKNYLTNFHQENPLKVGERLSEIRNKFFSKAKHTVSNALLELFDIDVKKDIVKLKDFSVQLGEEESIVKSLIVKKYRNEGYKLVKVDFIKDQINNKVVFDDMFALLVKEGELVRIENDLFMLQETLDTLISYMSTIPVINLGALRDYTESNRKSIFAILEYCDRAGITKRVGDERILLK